MESRSRAQLDELRALVDEQPDDANARRLLVEALLEVDSGGEACAHATVLHEMVDETWAVELHAAACEKSGDALGAARLRKAMRAAQEMLDDSEQVRDEHHPSRSEVTSLRLMPSPSDFEDGMPARRLDDIVGLATVKGHLQRMIAMLRASENVSASSWLGGSLFYGPPSCGKRFSASVLAGELDARFVFVQVTPGMQTHQLRDLLADATDDKQRTVLFLDDLDDLAVPATPVVAMLDRVTREHRTIVIGAATFPWRVSTELVRNGRLDDILLVLPPDAPARRLFFEMRGSEEPRLDDSDIDWLVHQTEGHSFGELESILQAIEGSDPGHDAVRSAFQCTPPGSAAWLTEAGHHALMNQHSGLYDDLVSYFRNRQRHP